MKGGVNVEISKSTGNVKGYAKYIFLMILRIILINIARYKDYIS